MTQPAATQTHLPLDAVVPATSAGQRLDAVLAQLYPDYSRSRLQNWNVSGLVTVNGRVVKGKARVTGGEQITLALPPDITSGQWEELLANGLAAVPAEPMDIDLVHTDAHIHVVNKSIDCVMHPAPGHPAGTLMNGLLHLDPTLLAVPRAGIVHRLDKDTSGLCVVARTLKAHASLVGQLQDRSMGREYSALVAGEPPDEGTIDAPIGRHPRDRKRMAVTAGGKTAVTHFQVEERFDGAALLAVRLETGRTHQIRVHCRHLGFPILGDSIYGRPLTPRQHPFGENPVVAAFNRQALHARHLRLIHPETGEGNRFSSELPADMTALLEALRRFSSTSLTENNR